MTEWFKCSEIPPPDDGYYLTFDGHCIFVGTVMYREDDGTYFFAGNGPIWGVTHWAQLPNPPKE